MNLRKFPVTAPDGTEYQVAIGEGSDYLYGKYASVILSVPARRRKFRVVYTKMCRQDAGDYVAANPDYINMAERTVAEYSDRQREKAEAATRKQEAVDRFNAWNGRVDV